MAVELYDEHEQSERVRKWIKEYSATIAMGLILAFAGIFGFRYWQDHRAEQLALGSEYYQVIQGLAEQGDAEAAAAEYETMSAAVGRSAYTGLAGLHVADRKSTRLNSSHVAISYAVFCLKKKKKI